MHQIVCPNVYLVFENISKNIWTWLWCVCMWCSHAMMLTLQYTIGIIFYFFVWTKIICGWATCLQVSPSNWICKKDIFLKYKISSQLSSNLFPKFTHLSTMRNQVQTFQRITNCICSGVPHLKQRRCFCSLFHVCRQENVGTCFATCWFYHFIKADTYLVNSFRHQYSIFGNQIWYSLCHRNVNNILVPVLEWKTKVARCFFLCILFKWH